MTARVSTDSAHGGLQALVLENELLRAVVLPELGGKLWQLTGQQTGREFLWHNAQLQPGQVSFGATYDDNFFGGWDELFPNDVPEDLAGETFPDHGELWTPTWDWSIQQDTDTVVAVKLALRAPISGCLIEKTLVLKAGEPCLRIHHRITNTLARELPFLWKQHVAVPVNEPARIGLGAKTMYLEDFGQPRAGRAGDVYSWPYHIDDAGVQTDMSLTLPESSAVSEFQYATEMNAGWCAITYQDGAGLGLAFDRDVFRSCWLFGSYGGWNGFQTLILEPCTGYPIQVSQGATNDTHQILAPGQVLETSMTAVIYDDMAEVTGIDADGHVAGPRLTQLTSALASDLPEVRVGADPKGASL